MTNSTLTPEILKKMMTDFNAEFEPLSILQRPIKAESLRLPAMPQTFMGYRIVESKFLPQRVVETRHVVVEEFTWRGRKDWRTRIEVRRQTVEDVYLMMDGTMAMSPDVLASLRRTIEDSMPFGAITGTDAV